MKLLTGALLALALTVASPALADHNGDDDDDDQTRMETLLDEIRLVLEQQAAYLKLICEAMREGAGSCTPTDQVPVRPAE